MAGQSRVSGIDVNAKGFEESLLRALERMRVKSEEGIQRLSIDISNRAKELCPVDTGRLRASIRTDPIRRDERGAYVEVGVWAKDIQDKEGGEPAKGGAVGANYAWDVEFGTYKMKAQPFMRPAMAEATGLAPQALGGD